MVEEELVLKRHRLFDFLNDERYKLMLDMSKESHKKNDSFDIIKRYNSINKKEFYDVCHEHELDGVVGCYAYSLGLQLPDYWETEYNKQKYHQEYLREKAKEICAAMDEVGIPMVILKNGGIMISMIPDAVKCPMEDIDSLIKKKDFFKAHEVLISHGFIFKFRSEYEEDKLDEAYRHGSSEYYILMPDGEKMWFELSWRAIDGRWIRPDIEPSTDEFVERSFVPQGTKVHVLSPEDNLLQVSIHTAKHSYCRAPGLRLHMDVDRIVAHEKIDWNLFLDKVNATHTKTSTFISLYIPFVIFGTKIPKWVLKELKTKKTSIVLNMLANAGLPHPKDRKFNKIQFLKFQTSLYDSKRDLLKVIYPGKEWMNHRYNCSNGFQRIYSTIIRILDLVGIRLKKR